MEESCQAMAEEQASELAHSHVWMCELEPDHDGPHVATYEWTSKEDWVNVANEPTLVE